MDPGIRNQVRLELVKIDIQGSVKSERGCNGRHNLSDEPVQIGIGWPVDVEVPTADVVDGLIINHESAVRVLESGVRCQDTVVGLDNSGGWEKNNKYNKKPVPLATRSIPTYQLEVRDKSRTLT